MVSKTFGIFEKCGRSGLIEKGVSIYYTVNIYYRPSIYYRFIVGLLGFRPNLLVLHILSIYRQFHVLNNTLNIIH